MNCEKCFHKDVCHRYLTEPRTELDLTGCTHFIDISDYDWQSAMARDYGVKGDRE